MVESIYKCLYFTVKGNEGAFELDILASCLTREQQRYRLILVHHM